MFWGCVVKQLYYKVAFSVKGMGFRPSSCVVVLLSLSILYNIKYCFLSRVWGLDPQGQFSFKGIGFRPSSCCVLYVWSRNSFKNASKMVSLAFSVKNFIQKCE